MDDMPVVLTLTRCIHKLHHVTYVQQIPVWCVAFAPYISSKLKPRGRLSQWNSLSSGITTMFGFEDLSVEKQRSPVTMSIRYVYRCSFQLLWLVPVLLISFAKDVDEHVYHTLAAI